MGERTADISPHSPRWNFRGVAGVQGRALDREPGDLGSHPHAATGDPHGCEQATLSQDSVSPSVK